MKLVSKAIRLAVAGGMITGMMAINTGSSHATVTAVGSCTNLLAVGGAKSATLGSGITDTDNQDIAISTKGVDPSVNKGTNLGSCSFNSGLSTPDSGKPAVKGYNGTKSVLKWGTKLYSVESDCDVTDTGDTTEWPLAGTLAIVFTDLNNAAKNNALSAAIVVDGFTEDDPSDVVNFHGLVAKGVAVGADVGGQSEFDPIVKDKTQLTGTPYFGYQFDVASALGCTTATQGDANILAFMNGSVGGASQLLAIPVSGIAFSVGTP